MHSLIKAVEWGPPAVKRFLIAYAMAGCSAGAYGTFLNYVSGRKIDEQSGETNAKR